MPHFATHLITLEKTIEKLIEIDPIYEDYFDSWGARHMARWGAIGPDTFFWSYAETEGAANVVQSVFAVGRDVLEPFREIEKIIEPWNEDNAELREYLSGGSVPAIDDLIEEITTLLSVILTNVGTSLADFHTLLEPPTSGDTSETEWRWYDILHNRNTGRFAEMLLRQAQESDATTRKPMVAYALGYLTHIATDIVGHSYVNSFSGGPYRLQWHRHITGENALDSWAWRELSDGCFDTETHSAEGLPFAQALRFMDVALFDDRLASVYAEAFARTYPDPDSHPEFLTQLELADLFTVYRRHLRNATGEGGLSAPTPQTGETDIFEDFLEPPPGIPSPWDPDTSFEELATAIVSFISWASKTVTKILLLPVALAMVPVGELVQWFCQKLRQIIHDMYLASHLLLVLEGYVLPASNELHESELVQFQELLDLRNTYPASRDAPASIDDEPFTLSSILPPIRGHHLKLPESSAETPATWTGPFTLGDAPSRFIESSGVDLSELARLVHRYATAEAPGPDPTGAATTTEDISSSVVADSAAKALGSAPDWGALLIILALDRLGLTESPIDLGDLASLDLRQLDLNLNGDRGFGWKCWRGDVEWSGTEVSSAEYFHGEYGQ